MSARRALTKQSAKDWDDDDNDWHVVTWNTFFDRSEDWDEKQITRADFIEQRTAKMNKNDGFVVMRKDKKTAQEWNDYDPTFTIDDYTWKGFGFTRKERFTKLITKNEFERRILGLAHPRIHKLSAEQRRRKQTQIVTRLIECRDRVVDDYHANGLYKVNPKIYDSFVKCEHALFRDLGLSGGRDLIQIDD